MSDADLAALEQRVTEKLAAARPKWDLPDIPALPAEAVEAPPLPDYWPQFPWERWAIAPARRAQALVLADKLIDQGKLAEAGWLVGYGGKVRIS
ncbi:hypothetical protein CRM89_00230 [Nocardia sp. FDAARGOS_372]|nr:hypothetical protein CRM89_00230 [Nocardia sp. FDAARGOS_372]